MQLDAPMNLRRPPLCQCDGLVRGQLQVLTICNFIYTDVDEKPEARDK